MRVAALVVFLASSAVAAREEKMSWAALPSAAQETIRRVAGASRIVEVEKQVAGGVTTYEAEYNVAGVEHSVRVGAGGELIEVEREMDPARLPIEIRDAVRKALPLGSVREAEEIHAGGGEAVSCYELEVEDRGRRRELKVRPSGEIVEDCARTKP